MKKNNLLTNIRKKIDQIDQELLHLMNARAALAIEVGKIKTEKKEASFYCPAREQEVLKNVAENNPGPLDAETLTHIFRVLMEACLRLQKKALVAYLGPEGTFSHMAAMYRFGENMEGMPQKTIKEVFDCVDALQDAYGVVPIKNSTAGFVEETLKGLREFEINICDEIYLPIQHHFLRARKAHKSVEKIIAHPLSFVQCRDWLNKYFPAVPQVPVESNALAAILASKELDSAAIAGDLAQTYYGLEKIHANIQDRADNQTCFLIIEKAKSKK